MSRWRIHLALCAVLALQLILWWAGHRSDSDLQERGASPNAAERVEALHLLLERRVTRLDHPLAEELLASEDPLEVEFAHTTAVCKHTGAQVQYRHLKNRIEAGDLDAHFWRSFVLLRRKIGVVVGAGGRLSRRELGWWVAAQADRPLPSDELLEHIRANP